MAVVNRKTLHKVRLKTQDKCAYCGRYSKKLEVHHIVYKSNGGTNHVDNLVLLCGHKVGCQAHYHIHRGKKRTEIEPALYKLITNLNLCWMGKLKPPQIEEIEELTGLQCVERKTPYRNRPKNLRKT